MKLGTKRDCESRPHPPVSASRTALIGITALLLLSAPASRLSWAGQRLTLMSTEFSHGATIPNRCTCSGENVSPRLRWSNPPAGTRSFALIVTDPDAPGGNFTHWVAFNMPASQHDLSEGIPKRATIALGGAQGSNDFSNIGYGGPCPPPGSPHHYLFRLYALDSLLPLKPGARRGQVERAMRGHILGQAELVGLFGR